MEMQRELDILPPLTPEARRKAERDAVLRAAGIRPASSRKPRPDYAPPRIRRSLIGIIRSILMR